MTNKLLKLKEELTAELSNNILPFWMYQAIDIDQGGFLGHIDFSGQADPLAPKGGILNARILWTFSSASRILKNPEYLKMAQRSYAYVVDHFLDKKHGGTYWEVDYLGERLNTKKQIYALAFTIYGLVEYYMASGDDQALKYAISLYRDIERHSFDDKNNGYFEAFTREWEPIEDLRLSAKDQNESKTMNTHLHILEAYTNLYRVWKDDELKAKLKNLIELFQNKFVNENGNLNLFFDDEWNLKSDLISFGHDIESSWLIQEAAEVLGDKSLIEKSKILAVKIAKENLKGIDEDGGLYYEYFPSTGEWDMDKHWWPQGEAMVAYLNAYQISNDKKYLETALNSWSFIQKYIVDKENGEWHWSVNKEGKPSENDVKAGFWKCPYHNGRACLEVITRLK
jgi:mannobiose 2-epimerase